MSNVPNLNEFPVVNIETPDASQQKGMSWLTVAAWFCLLWVFVAYCTFWGTLDNIDFDGTTKKEYLPYEPLIAFVVYTGLAAIPVGFGCGLMALLYRKDYGLPLLTTLVLGLFMIGLVYNKFQTYQSWNQWNNQPPVVLPAASG